MRPDQHFALVEQEKQARVAILAIKQKRALARLQIAIDAEVA